VNFEWDRRSARGNLRKHGISFEVAIAVFGDNDRIERVDASGLENEERWGTVGLVDGIEIYVLYTTSGGVLRLISARRARRHEREEYWKREDQAGSEKPANDDEAAGEATTRDEG
jgi:uncharacterized DUF497 family protein